MVAGMEKYYQIARCFRDEDFRADRQPEFTQLDIEMSFIDQEDILAVAEKIVARVWKESVNYEISLPIPRMTYADAMRDYGSDKPDLRFGNKLVDLTTFFSDTAFRVFQAPYVGAVVMPGGAASPRRELDAWQDWAKARGAKGLAYILVNDDLTLGGPVSKNLSDKESTGIVAAAGSEAVAHGNSTIVGLTTAQVTQTTSTKGSTVYFTPATAGTYTITVFHDGGATPDGLLGVGEAIGTSTVVIAADGLPSITFTQYGSTSDALGAAEFGKLVKISLRNGTLAANLGATEVLTLTGPTGTVFDQVSTLSGTSLSMTSVDGSNGVTQTLTSANFNSLGDAYVNVSSSVAGTSITVSAVVTGGTAAGASGSFSFASVDAAAVTYTGNAGITTQTNPGALLGVLQATDAWSVKRGVATTEG
jgi:hypothetical protein